MRPKEVTRDSVTKQNKITSNVARKMNLTIEQKECSIPFWKETHQKPLQIHIDLGPVRPQWKLILKKLILKKLTAAIFTLVKEINYPILEN